MTNFDDVTKACRWIKEMVGNEPIEKIKEKWVAHLYGGRPTGFDLLSSDKATDDTVHDVLIDCQEDLITLYLELDLITQEKEKMRFFIGRKSHPCWSCRDKIKYDEEWEIHKKRLVCSECMSALRAEEIIL